MRLEQRTQVAGSAWLSCMTHAINVRRRWLGAGKAATVRANGAGGRQREAAMTPAIRFRRWLSVSEMRREQRNKQTACSTWLA